MRRYMLQSGNITIRWSEAGGKFYVEDALAPDPLVGEFDEWDKAMDFVWHETPRLEPNVAMVVRDNPVCGD